MSLTVDKCPFCDYDDVEIGEVSPGEFAVDCPECRCIGPVCGDVMESIAKWNEAIRRPNVVVNITAVPDVPAWWPKLSKDDEAAAERQDLNAFNAQCAPQVPA